MPWENSKWTEGTRHCAAWAGPNPPHIVNLGPRIHRYVHDQHGEPYLMVDRPTSQPQRLTNGRLILSTLRNIARSNPWIRKTPRMQQGKEKVLRKKTTGPHSRCITLCMTRCMTFCTLAFCTTCGMTLCMTQCSFQRVMRQRMENWERGNSSRQSPSIPVGDVKQG